MLQSSLSSARHTVRQGISQVQNKRQILTNLLKDATKTLSREEIEVIEKVSDAVAEFWTNVLRSVLCVLRPA